VIESLLEKTLPDLGVVSLAELSRNWFTSDRVAIAGVYQGKLVSPFQVQPTLSTWLCNN